MKKKKPNDAEDIEQKIMTISRLSELSSRQLSKAKTYFSRLLFEVSLFLYSCQTKYFSDFSTSVPETKPAKVENSRPFQELEKSTDFLEIQLNNNCFKLRQYEFFAKSSQNFDLPIVANLGQPVQCVEVLLFGKALCFLASTSLNASHALYLVVIQQK